jgi:hypothetical protein
MSKETAFQDGYGGFRFGFRCGANKYPPAEPEVLRLRAPQRGLIAIEPKTAAPEARPHDPKGFDRGGNFLSQHIG